MPLVPSDVSHDDYPNLTFGKSPYSSDTADCVEMAVDGDRVRLRDSKAPKGAVLSFTDEDWRAFVGLVKATGPLTPGAEKTTTVEQTF